MKTALFALFLSLFLNSTALPGKKTEPVLSPTAAPAFWPQDSTVTVYFVRGLFTVEQKQVLQQTLEAWASSKANSTIRFSYAGETGGLIDCLGCLTLTRQALHTNGYKRDATFNRLRGDHTGRLISAWIGFNSSLTDSQKLRNSLVQVLGAQQLLRPATSRNADLQEIPSRRR
jgi:hypothetical protein